MRRDRSHAIASWLWTMWGLPPMIVATMLRSRGQQVRTAASGPEALAMIEQEKPELILSDISMPEMTGYELAQEIRRRPEWNDIWLVAVTGYGQESDKKLAKEAGFNSHLVKPISTETLNACCVGSRGHGQATPEPLFLLCVAKSRRLGKGKENHLLAGCGADVMVQGHHLDAGDLLDHRFHDRTGRFDQMGPYLLQQVPPLLSGKRLDQMLFGRGQHALKPDHEEIAEQVGVDVLRATAHVILLEATNRLRRWQLRSLPGFSWRGPPRLEFCSSRNPRLPHEPSDRSKRLPKSIPNAEEMQKSYCLSCAAAYDCSGGKVAASLIAAWPLKSSDD